MCSAGWRGVFGGAALYIPTTINLLAGMSEKQKVIIVGAGPVGCLAALYAASRGDEVEVYELRGGMLLFFSF